MKFLLFCILTLFCYNITAQTTISGDIGGMTFEATGNPWIVTDNITIEKGKAVKIQAGCVFLFKQYTGIAVHGELVVNGSKESPVVFTSFNDNKYNHSVEVLPNPFDWNGIVIYAESKSILLSYMSVSFSVFGIKSQKSDITIKNSTFKQNGQFHFTVLGEIQPVSEGFPFSYGNITVKKQQKNIRPLKVAALATGGGGVICGVVSGIFWNNYRKAWDDAEHAKKSTEITDANKREEDALKSAGILTGVSITLLSTAAVLYIVDYKQNKEKPVSFSPIFGKEYAGIIFSCNF